MGNMAIEALFNQFGIAGAFALVAGGVALPLIVAGVVLWRRAVRREQRWRLIEAARVKVADVARGRVAAAGVFRRLGDGRGTLEADGALLLVEGAVPLSDRAEVMVVGWATRQVDDPRAGYRGFAKVWCVEGDGPTDPIEVHPGDAQLSRRMRRAATMQGRIAAALLAVGVAVTVASGVICYRAAVGEEIIAAD